MPGVTLTSGQSVTSVDGEVVTVMQGDGNLVLRSHGRALWSSGTEGNPGARLIGQADGNAVILTGTHNVVWDSGTAGLGTNPQLEVQPTGELDLVSTAGTTWHVYPAAATTLLNGESLHTGQVLHDTYGHDLLTMQADGNLVFRRNGQSLWSSGTAGQPGAHATLQHDGNLVIRDRTGLAIWASGTAGSGPATALRLPSGGTFSLYKQARKIWTAPPVGR